MSLRVRGGIVEILDQRVLPKQETWLPVHSLEDIFEYILVLAVRGAPMIGCAAALSLAWWRFVNPEGDFAGACAHLKTARPTAVNLMYCCDALAQLNKDVKDYTASNVTRLALEFLDHERDMCAQMAQHGASLVKDGDNILTHCNTGSLATIGVGTALGVIREAHKQGKKIHVYVDETRPLLQGGRLTAYELKREGIPYTIICDNMAAHLMKQGKVQRIFVGADRIAINGDFANKIGTYSLAVVAKYHGVPFHPVAPVSTVDFECTSGKDIPIEERKMDEVFGAFGTTWAPEGSQGYNPAFDVTPMDLVESVILDSGIYTKEMVEAGALKSIARRHHV
jgi:methylthioribose-1-phosphate isomerase